MSEETTTVKLVPCAFPILTHRRDYKKWRKTLETWLHNKDFKIVFNPNFLNNAPDKINKTALYEITRHIDSDLFNSFDALVKCDNAHALLNALDAMWGSVSEEEKRADKEKWQMILQRDNEDVDSWFKRVSQLKYKINSDNHPNEILTDADVIDKLITGIKPSWSSERRALKLKNYKNIPELINDLNALENGDKRNQSIRNSNSQINFTRGSRMPRAQRLNATPILNNFKLQNKPSTTNYQTNFNKRGSFRGRGNRGGFRARGSFNRGGFRPNYANNSNYRPSTNFNNPKIKCLFCNSTEHKSKDCFTCFKCGGRGHITRNCQINGPGLSKQSQQTFVNYFTTMAQGLIDANDADTQINTEYEDDNTQYDDSLSWGFDFNGDSNNAEEYDDSFNVDDQQEEYDIDYTLYE
jgi:Zinc knuckle